MARVCGRGIERESADGIERESAMGSSESLRLGVEVERETASGVDPQRGSSGSLRRGGPAGPIVFLVFLLGRKDTWGNKMRNKKS